MTVSQYVIQYAELFDYPALTELPACLKLTTKRRHRLETIKRLARLRLWLSDLKDKL